MDVRAELVARIRQAAAAGLMSEADRDLRITNVRNAGSAAELDLIRRDLDRLQPVPTDAPSEADAVQTGGERTTLPPPRSWSRASTAVPRSGPPRRAVLLGAVLLGSVWAIGVMITWVYRSMRAVMDIGGACASGGPYVSVQPCPDGTWMIGAAVPVLILVALVGTGVAVALRAPPPLLLMWAGLFGSLGWNFFDYADRDESGAGLLVCGVVFWLMALPAVVLLVLLVVIKGRRAGSGQGVARALLRSCTWLGLYAVAGGVGVWLGWDWWSQLA